MKVLGTHIDKPVIAQCDPQRRTIFCASYYTKYVNDMSSTQIQEDSFYLWFPYIIFCKYPFSTNILPRKYTRVGFSPKPIRSLDDIIYLPPLPNTGSYQGTYITCGCAGDFELPEAMSLYWATKFITREIEAGEEVLNKMFGRAKNWRNVHASLLDWEKLSLEQFNAKLTTPIKIPSMPTQVTFREFIEYGATSKLIQLEIQ